MSLVSERAAVAADIPFVDLTAQQAEIMPEIEPLVLELLRSGAFIGGAAVMEFERAYAASVGVKHCVGVANGTDALQLALRASGIGPGDEVIVPANTFIATAEAVSLTGAMPVLVDVDPVHLLIDPDAVAAAVTARTRAIIPVHLYGQVAAVEALEPIAECAGALIIEDAAQAQGATRHGRGAGSLGAIAGTSFYPGKNLGAAGDAGAVTTDDEELADRVRLIGGHGSRAKYEHETVGTNSRLDALQAVVLKAKLERLSGWNEARRAAAVRYGELLAGTAVGVPESMPGNVDVWHLYVVRVQNRAKAIEALAGAGIGTGIHYPTPVHLTEAYRSLGHERGAFPVAERAAEEILSLPMFPHLTAAQQERVAEVLLGAVG
ncbi:DegT/DnrJ/EryC1/StrS family aminotransferase [Ruicaihuangia caeni]|uniref:DegT/DnrJ/EryC1/StrS family aminotransferase n=1 Tax=Ruicaihuangia caeni TaxID=3042517 RepID=A0AAW6T7I6_9MICO|nr:DegT/DnrJ/EryC1/StrS family aminotransferase [Klugiella sp. YN-L-19]MDI2097602.1 DegT/DnrJ/EryC1/StrS family aminotransferase [Klugiella sp. YN-L-19]